MRILLTGALAYTKEQIAQIESLGMNTVFMQQEADALPVKAGDVDATVCNGLFLHHNIEEFENLKYIQLTSAGFDRVPLEEIKQRGITINNARGVYSIPLAEWAMGRILEHYKNFNGFNLSQKKKEWNKDRGIKEINGTKSAIIGAGNIGQEVAKRLSAFGSSVTGYDVILGERSYFDSVHHVNDLSSEIDDYDIVVLTAPYTPETHHIISKEILQSLKNNAILVNIARGGLIDEQAMCEVLTDRKDLFAALDVFEAEPLSEESPLWKLDNVAVSPHNSFVSEGNSARMFAVMYQNLKKFIER